MSPAFADQRRMGLPTLRGSLKPSSVNLSHPLVSSLAACSAPTGRLFPAMVSQTLYPVVVLGL